MSLALRSLALAFLPFVAADSPEPSPTRAPARPPAGPAHHFGDFDGDGLLDVYAVRPSSTDRLFKNVGDGTFVDVSESVGLGGLVGSRLALWLDVDGDGWLDLYVCAANGESRLARNELGKSFTNVTAAAGLAHADGSELYAESFDFDLDGRPDLRIVTEKQDRLFRNAGDTRFELVDLGISEAAFDSAVIALPTPEPEPPLAPVDPGQPTVPTPTLLPRPAGPRAPLNPSRGPSGSPLAPPAIAAATPTAICAGSVRDQSGGPCIEASTTPTLGELYPLSTNFNVSSTGRVGIGTTAPTQKLDVVGSVRASGQLMSTQATGTAPLVVSSTTKVTSLNADQIDGFDSSAFSQLGSSIESAEIANGTIVDADVSASAAIAGTKVNPSFGAQSITTTGALSAVGWRTFSNGTLPPNVVGGVVENVVQDGAIGATIGGGGLATIPHEVADDYGTVGGGGNNTAGLADGDPTLSPGATVGGGIANFATANRATVGGGGNNNADGEYSVVSGGLQNDATGMASAVPGGVVNLASGDFSLAAGRYARAVHAGAFVWADSNNNGATGAYFDSTGIDQFLIRAAGGVGIGTADPEAPLHVLEGSAGPLAANSNSIAVFERSAGGWVSILGDDGNSKGILFGKTSDPDSGGIVYDQASVASNAMQFRTGGNSTKMTILGTGEVGIGRQPTANDLEVEGSASKTTAGSWLANSDRRIKADVREIEGALDTLERVRPVAFRYTDEYRAAHPSIEDVDYYNVIAQEFAEVFPDYVKPSGEGDILQVDTYPALIHALAAIRELHQVTRAQSREIAALRAELSELRRAVESPVAATR